MRPDLDSSPRAISFALVALTIACIACVPAVFAEPQAAFTTWHQGFQKDTGGWYGQETQGPLGWCGDISRVTREEAVANDPGPSAGKAYSTVSIGPCNAFWSSLGVPFGAPYAPGPDLAIASDAWPRAGYVTDLDVYLDPAWSGNYRGNFEFAGVPGTTLV